MSINDHFRSGRRSSLRRREAVECGAFIGMRQLLFLLVEGLSSTTTVILKILTNIYLRVDFETLYSRIQNDKATTPLKPHQEEFKKIFDGRCLYEDIVTPILWMSRTKHLKKLRRSSMLVGYLGPKGSLSKMVLMKLQLLNEFPRLASGRSQMSSRFTRIKRYFLLQSSQLKTD